MQHNDMHLNEARLSILRPQAKTSLKTSF